MDVEKYLDDNGYNKDDIKQAKITYKELLTLCTDLLAQDREERGDLTAEPGKPLIELTRDQFMKCITDWVRWYGEVEARRAVDAVLEEVEGKEAGDA